MNFQKPVIAVIEYLQELLSEKSHEKMIENIKYYSEEMILLYNSYPELNETVS